jgi:integrase
VTKTKIDLSTVRERDKLRPKANRTPHWQRLRPGLFLGYRPAKDDAAGSWSARSAIDDDRREQALGSFGQFPPNERFAKAKAAAETFMALQETGGQAKALLITVADAARAYQADHPSAEQCFRLSVYSDPVGEIHLNKLRRAHLVEWRKRLAGRPLQGKGGQRAPASINREMVPLRAALRQHLALGQPKTEAAWQEAIKPIPRKDSVRRRTLYLERQERQALLDNISAEAEPFGRALCLLPVRPGALAQLTVADWVRKTGSLTIRAGTDKGHGERFIHVGAAAAALLTAQSRDKTPSAPLFMRADGTAWTASTWKVPIRAAAVAAELDPKTCAYTLRHSVITDLVQAGVPTLTIAQIAGTSVEMIEQHYGQYRQDTARKALDAIAL